jgi:hypothetical protein
MQRHAEMGDVLTGKLKKNVEYTNKILFHQKKTGFTDL